MVEKVEASRALIGPDTWCPQFWWEKHYSGVEQQLRTRIKEEIISLTTSYWDEILKLPWKDKGPWQTPRSMVLEISGLMFFAEKRKYKSKGTSLQRKNLFSA